VQSRAAWRGWASLGFRKHEKVLPMCSDAIIRVDNLSKCYSIYNNPRDRLKQFLLPRFQRLAGIAPQQYFREFWALQNISFTINKGETVGIIGRNGSGKSTLLQLICGTVAPTSGNISVNGRIAALLELGSGFNPEFTGRENIYLNGALLGMSRQEIDDRFDDIASFADIGSFIEQPVKIYSSGMFVRLAFSVNIMSKPAVMIVDEALSVGDMNFQAKCMTALTKIQNNGATILFVSHDIGAVKSLCSKALYLEYGQLKAAGNAPEIAEQYIRAMREELSDDVRKFSRISQSLQPENFIVDTSSSLSEPSGLVFKQSDAFDQHVAIHRYGSGGARITYVELVDNDGNPTQIVAFNQKISIRIYVESASIQQISVNFHIRDNKKINIVGCGFAQAGQELLTSQKGAKYVIEYSLQLPLQEGNYSILVQISTPIIAGQKAEFIDVVDDAVVFKMERGDMFTLWSKVHLFPSLRLQEFINDDRVAG
jgi:lipopolysaccharide transport system ATP-binding protein